LSIRLTDPKFFFFCLISTLLSSHYLVGQLENLHG
jgi:hypothetical protein